MIKILAFFMQSKYNLCLDKKVSTSSLMSGQASFINSLKRYIDKRTISLIESILFPLSTYRTCNFSTFFLTYSFSGALTLSASPTLTSIRSISPIQLDTSKPNPFSLNLDLTISELQKYSLSLPLNKAS